MSREVHHVVLVIVRNPNQGKPMSYGSGRFLAVAHFGAVPGGPESESPLRSEAAAGSRDTAGALAVRRLLREARRRGVA